MSPFLIKCFTFYVIFSYMYAGAFAADPWDPQAYKEFIDIANNFVLTSDCCHQSLKVSNNRDCSPCTSTYSPPTVEGYSTTLPSNLSQAYSTSSPSYTSTNKPKPVYILRPLITDTSSFYTSADSKINRFLRKSEKLATKLTKIATSPVVFVASKVNFMASKLPNELAAKGALLGSAIATPIQALSTLISGVNSALVGKLVTVPIALGAKVGAGFIAMNNEMHNAKVYLKRKMSHLRNKFGQTLLLQPIGVLKGAKSSVGSVLTFNGVKLRALGKVVTKLGNAMEASGNSLKNSTQSVYGNPNYEPKPNEVVLCVEEKNNDTVTDTYYSFAPNSEQLVTDKQNTMTSISEGSNTVTSWSFVPLETK